MKMLALSFALLASFALVAVGCGEDQSDGSLSTDEAALLSCNGAHHGDPGRHIGHHHGRHHHHHGGPGMMGTGGTGGQPHLTGSAGTMGGGGSMGMAGSMGTGGSGGTVMVDPRCNPLDGMVSWWHADGDYDDAVGSNDGATAGGVTFAAGEDNQAFDLNGASNAFVTVPHDPSLMMSGAITIDAWINQASLGGRIVDKASANGSDGYLLDVIGDKLRMYIATDAIVSQNPIPAGMWVHVAGVFDGNGLGVYINGALDSNSLTNGHALIPNTLALRMGEDSGGGSNFIGEIDEPRIWNRALSADEIAQLFWQGQNCH
jgi:hypothetical protein